MLQVIRLKPILITGIQPTNRLTLGNYLGAIKPIIKEQDTFNCYLFVADWHSVTIPLSLQQCNYKQTQDLKWQSIKMYLACGINSQKTKIFVQSEIKEHLEMFYFLLTHSSLGELQRMTQYKHLSKQFLLPNGTEMSLMGLLVYPVLMAADILIYDSDFVAIGEDQTQHLELTIHLAERINNRYKKNIFRIPKAFNPKKNKSGIKIKDLQDPTIKMSKSNKNHEGTIFMDDDIQEIKRKIMKSKTDSLGKINLDRENQPGIYNLLEIYSEITNISLEKSLDLFRNKTYKELKEGVCEVVIKEISEIQKKLKSIQEQEIAGIVDESSKHCREICKQKLENLKNNI